MKITRILLLLLLSINLHAQTDSLELENLKRQESSTINQLQSFRQQKSNELQAKNEELSSFKKRLNSQQSTQRQLTSKYNQLVKELDNYHANEVKLNLYHQFINQHFFKASEMSKDVQNFYELILEENQLPINAKFMLLDNAVIYSYSVDNEGYVSNYKILNSSDKLKKKFEKLKEKERLVVIAETAIEIYRLTGIDVHYFELKQNVGALDIKVKVIANDISSTNSSITMTKQDLMNLENTWNRKINLKEEELVAIQNSVESLKNKTVKIGNQVWMSENLNVNRFRNGDPIPHAKTDEEWEKAGKNGEPAWCYYKNDPANGAKYGKLYNWYAVNDPRGLAPEGWKIPSDEDWTRLTDFLGGESVAGQKMKSTEFLADNDGESDNGTNESGFSGLPGGYRSRYGIFDHIGKAGFWWSSTESNTFNAWIRNLYYGGGNVTRNYFYKEGLSVRCLRD